MNGKEENSMLKKVMKFYKGVGKGLKDANKKMLKAGGMNIWGALRDKRKKRKLKADTKSPMDIRNPFKKPKKIKKKKKNSYSFGDDYNVGGSV
jgi:hypothetical protein